MERELWPYRFVFLDFLGGMELFGCRGTVLFIEICGLLIVLVEWECECMLLHFGRCITSVPCSAEVAVVIGEAEMWAWRSAPARSSGLRPSPDSGPFLAALVPPGVFTCSSWRSATRLNQRGTTTPWRRGQGQGGGAAAGQRKAASRMQETFTVTPGGPTRASAARACSCGGGHEMKKNKSAAGDEDVTNLFQQYDHREKL